MRGAKTVERAGDAGSVGTGCRGFHGLREIRCGFDVRLMGKAASLIDLIAGHPRPGTVSRFSAPVETPGGPAGRAGPIGMPDRDFGWRRSRVHRSEEFRESGTRLCTFCAQDGQRFGLERGFRRFDDSSQLFPVPEKDYRGKGVDPVPFGNPGFIAHVFVHGVNGH